MINSIKKSELKLFSFQAFTLVFLCNKRKFQEYRVLLHEYKRVVNFHNCYTNGLPFGEKLSVRSSFSNKILLGTCEPLPSTHQFASPFWAYVATYHWCDSQLFGCFSVCFFVCLFFVSLLLLSCTNNNQGKQTESSYISCGLVQC